MKRLYLTHCDRYRVRLLNGQIVLCRWVDDTMQFVRSGGGTVDLERIAAVSAFAAEGRATVQWTPWDHCYRAIHRPVTDRVWQHPYARHRLRATA